MEITHYIYVLKLIPQLLNENNWTERENKIIETHFNYLKNLTAQGKAVLVGRTAQLDEKTFGIVIFQASSTDEARAIMENDPAVKEKIMTAEFYPFHIVLQKSGCC